MFEFPTPKELRQMRQDDKARGNAARMMSEGGVTPEVGHFYTVSKSFDMGDGSWAEDFWEVLSINGPKAYIKIHRDHGDPVVRFWEIENRAWFLADDAWKIRAAHLAPETPST